jgi:hypothetical protein
LHGTHTIADLFIEIQQIARLSDRRLYSHQDGTALAITLSDRIPSSEFSRLCSSLCEPHNIDSAISPR